MQYALVEMSSVAIRPGGRTALPVLLAALLAVGMVVDPRLAIIFSPILVLALLVTHPRIESAIVELVHGLASNAAIAGGMRSIGVRSEHHPRLEADVVVPSLEALDADAFEVLLARR